VTHKFTRFALFSACALVASLSTAVADTCVSGDTLAQYVALGAAGCTIGDKTFYDFSYGDTVSGGATATAAASVNVYTVGDTGEAIAGPDYGVQFESSWGAADGQTNDAVIQFDVAVTSGSNYLITDAGLAQDAFVNGTGSEATVAEQICQGVPCDLSTWDTYTFQANNGAVDSGATDTVISPSGAVTVAKDINVTGGSTGLGANLSIVQDVFSQTAIPEPRALSLLLGLGLVAGFAFRKKFQGENA
jgi:hypothetical protein